MQKYGKSFWQTMPFVRILLPLVAGIIIQFNLQPPLFFVCIILASGTILYVVPKFFSFQKFYFLRWLTGSGLNFLFFAVGCFLTINKDLQNDKNWIGKHYTNTDAVIVTIQEPLVEKDKSFKALATIEQDIKTNSAVVVKGDMLVYFQKDSLRPQIEYGSQILITKQLVPIANSGNPGGFNYKRYCAFQDIHYQVFLKAGDYKILSTTNKKWFTSFLITIKTWVISTLRKNIKDKDAVAVAEALLIGYRDDLDRELVQSYSNTGVVHIIAISGLHLGMIYGLLLWIFKPFKRKKWNKIIEPLVILFVLWIFTFLAGAVPSISRSAVMFTCIIAGQAFARKTSIYNTLAASAFLLLAYNPFYLWDVGFQLSFAAVISIVTFSKYIKRWLYFKNKLLNNVWSLCSVTLSAQILTLPFILYHFHQFPNLFLFTNIIIVPLSGVILTAELILLVVSAIPGVSIVAGKITEYLLWIMNRLIERTNRIPFSVTDGIHVNILQSILIYLVIATAAVWLIKKNKQSFFTSCTCMIAFVALRSIDIIHTNNQQKIIVYNIPQHEAIDVVQGGNYKFIGDSILLEDGFLKNFHLRPARIANRIDEGSLSNVFATGELIKTDHKKIIIVNQSVPISNSNKINADAIIISGNPRLYIKQLLNRYNCSLFVFDATNPLWKIRLWKKDCDSLHLHFHSIPEQGAFEMDI